MRKKAFSILGSTGSIGVQTLEIVSAFPDKFDVIGLTCGRNIDLFLKQILTFKPQIVSVLNKEDADVVKAFIKQHNLKTEVYSSSEGLSNVATDSRNQLLIVAIVGTAALLPTYNAIKKGIDIGLACKEVLVAAGALMMNYATQNNVKILPIDSEHSAIWQCLNGVKDYKKNVNKLILTASGGPFWELEKEEFKHITKSRALKHPNWEMGAKITIDSATLMNKGLEVIEAYHLFGIDFADIEVVIHPQSIIHSMVEFKDGTILNQLGLPDMRLPIQAVMTYPERWENNWPKTKISELPALTFHTPDFDKFSLLTLAFETGKEGGTYPVVMNAANESAVQLFLDEKIKFTDIPKVVKKSVDDFYHSKNPGFEEIIEIDSKVKKEVLECYETGFSITR